MELRQLKYFVRIVELGSLSRAAKDLFIAQPALSAQIMNLEKELDVRLLARSVRGVAPTEAGQALYLHAQAVLRQIERLRHDVQGPTPSGPVSIGMPTSAANVLAGPLIAAVGERFPDVRLKIVESLSGHLYELAANGRLELSLLFEPHPESAPGEPVDDALHHGGAHLPLVDEDLCLIHAPQDGDTPQRGDISVADAAAFRLALPAHANITRRLIDRAFDKAGVKMDLLAELDSLSTIQSIVTKGQAATILSPAAFIGPGALSGLSVRRIVDPPLVRRLSLYSSEVVGLGAAADQVALLIPELAHALVDSGTWEGASCARAQGSGQS